MHKCIPSITQLQYFHHSLTFLLIGPLVQRASVYLHTDDSSSFAVSNFLIITAWNLSVKGQYLSLPHTHMRLCTYTLAGLSILMKMKIEMVEKYTESSLYGRNENANVWNCTKFCMLCYSPLSCHFIPTWFNIFLIIALCKERALRSHLSTLSLTYGKMISQQAPALSVVKK